MLVSGSNCGKRFHWNKRLTCRLVATSHQNVKKIMKVRKIYFLKLKVQFYDPWKGSQKSKHVCLFLWSELRKINSAAGMDNFLPVGAIAQKMLLKRQCLTSGPSWFSYHFHILPFPLDCLVQERILYSSSWFLCSFVCFGNGNKLQLFGFGELYGFH